MTREQSLPRPYYADSLVQLYHGDALELLPRIAADVLVTDPPYGMAYDSGWSGAKVAGDETTVVRDKALAIWGDRPALVFGRWSCPRPEATRHVLTWDKGDWPGMGDLSLPWGPSTEEIYVLGAGFEGKRRGSILRDPRRPAPNALHPTEKPIGVLSQLILACAPSWVICDPFAGSGSTAVAAKALGRKVICIEIDERYCSRAAERCRQEVLDLGGVA